MNYQLCMKWGLELETLKKFPLGQSKLSRVRDGADPSSAVVPTETRTLSAHSKGCGGGCLKKLF